MKIAIDLDETLINNGNFYSPPGFWKLKRSARKYLRKVYENGHEFHLITCRSPEAINIVADIIGRIELKTRVRFASIQCIGAQSKVPFAISMNCNILIDDDIGQMRFCADAGPDICGIHIGHKRNRIPGTVACESWCEVYRLLVTSLGAGANEVFLNSQEQLSPDARRDAHKI